MIKTDHPFWDNTWGYCNTCGGTKRGHKTVRKPEKTPTVEEYFTRPL